MKNSGKNTKKKRDNSYQVSKGHGLSGEKRDWNSMSDLERSAVYHNAIDDIRKMGLKSVESMEREREREQYEERILSVLPPRRRVGQHPVKIERPSKSFDWSHKEYTPSEEVHEHFYENDKKYLSVADSFVEKVFGINLDSKLESFDESVIDGEPMVWNLYSKPVVEKKKKVGEGMRPSGLEDSVSEESYVVQDDVNGLEDTVDSTNVSKDSSSAPKDEGKVFAYNKNLYENLTLKVPNANREKFEKLPEVSMKDYFGTSLTSEALYKAARVLVSNKNKMSEAQMKYILDIGPKSMDMLDELVSSKKEMFENFSKVYQDFRIEKHAAKEEVEGMAFMANENLKDLKNDYSNVLKSRPGYFARNFGKVTLDKAKRNVAYVDAKTAISLAKNEARFYDSKFSNEFSSYKNFTNKKFEADREVERLRVMSEKNKFTRGLLEKLAA